MTDHYDHVWNPLDEDHFAQEMEAEAREAERDAQFSVHGTCRSCLENSELNPIHLCAGCTELNESLGGSLIAILTN